MKKIVNGLKYDTETSTCVAWVNNGYEEQNFNYWEEELYRTDNGSWFVRKAGGGNTQYATRYGNMRSSGELIEVLDEAKVKKWLEEHNKTEAYEKYFGNEIKDA